MLDAKLHQPFFKIYSITPQMQSPPLQKDKKQAYIAHLDSTKIAYISKLPSIETFHKNLAVKNSQSESLLYQSLTNPDQKAVFCSRLQEMAHCKAASLTAYANYSKKFGLGPAEAQNYRQQLTLAQSHMKELADLLQAPNPPTQRTCWQALAAQDDLDTIKNILGLHYLSTENLLTILTYQDLNGNTFLHHAGAKVARYVVEMVDAAINREHHKTPEFTRTQTALADIQQRLQTAVNPPLSSLSEPLLSRSAPSAALLDSKYASPQPRKDDKPPTIPELKKLVAKAEADYDRAKNAHDEVNKSYNALRQQWLACCSLRNKAGHIADPTQLLHIRFVNPRLVMAMLPAGSAEEKGEETEIKVESGHLNLSNLNLGLQDAPAIVECIRHMPGLTSLDLSNNHLGDAGCQLICAALVANRAVININFSNNLITDASTSAISDVSLSANCHITLSNNQLGHEFALNLYKRLASGQSCASFDLQNNPFSVQDLSDLQKVIPSDTPFKLGRAEAVSFWASVGGAGLGLGQSVLWAPLRAGYETVASCSSSLGAQTQTAWKGPLKVVGAVLGVIPAILAAILIILPALFSGLYQGWRGGPQDGRRAGDRLVRRLAESDDRKSNIPDLDTVLWGDAPSSPTSPRPSHLETATPSLPGLESVRAWKNTQDQASGSTGRLATSSSFSVQSKHGDPNEEALPKSRSSSTITRGTGLGRGASPV